MQLLVLLEKGRLGRKPAPGQGSLEFDEEAHPREAKGAGDASYKPGEFVPKMETGGGARDSTAPAAAKGEMAVHSKAFKKWFGDWEGEPQSASKVVDEAGEPLLVYHGSREKFTRFDADKTLSNTQQADYGEGFYFSPDRGHAELYAVSGRKDGTVEDGHVHAVYLNIRNPWRSNEPLTLGEMRRLRKALPRDGVLRQNPETLESIEFIVKEKPALNRKRLLFHMVSSMTRPDQLRQALGEVRHALQAMGYDGVRGEGEWTEWVAWEPEQIKSAANEGGSEPHDSEADEADAFAPRMSIADEKQYMVLDAELSSLARQDHHIQRERASRRISHDEANESLRLVKQRVEEIGHRMEALKTGTPLEQVKANHEQADVERKSRLKADYETRQRENPARRAALLAEYDSLKADVSALRQSRSSGSLTEEAWGTKVAPYHQRMKEIESLLPYVGALKVRKGNRPMVFAGPALLVKALRRVKPTPGQGTLDFDAEAHPRAPAGSEHGGEFVKKADAGAGGDLENPREHEGTKAPLPPVTDDAQASDEESLDPADPNYKYRDTGYIANSRKELAAQQIRRMVKAGDRISEEDVDWQSLEENPREAASLITKANVFGASTFDEMEARGVEPGAAFLIQKIYASVAAKPDDTPEARRNYVVGIDNLRDQLEEAKTVADVIEVLADVRQQVDGALYTADDKAAMTRLRAERDRLQGLAEADHEVSTKVYAVAQGARNEEMRARYKIEDTQRKKQKVNPERTKEHARLKEIADARWEELGVVVAAEKERDYRKQAFAVARQMSQIGDAARVRNVLDNPLSAAYRSLGAGFERAVKWRSFKGSDAFLTHVHNAKAGKIKDYSFARGEKKAGKATQRAIQFTLDVADEIRRRGGRPLVTDGTLGLKNAFGLRDVQSGNWVLDDPDAAKVHVEGAVGALMDLADVLGMQDREAGFNGRIALAFGARGKGGFNSAAAHWEPIHRVINLTKMHGYGALAHEWFHAFDNLVVEAAGLKKGNLAHVTDKPELLPAGPVRDALVQLVGAVRNSQFAQDARQMDAALGRKSPYWALSHEMMARAFQAFVEDGLSAQGRENTYLASGCDNDRAAYRAFGLKPFPAGAERARINQAMAQLWQVVRESQTLEKALRSVMPAPEDGLAKHTISRSDLAAYTEELKKALWNGDEA